jgi:hypothetical protein
VAYWYKHYSDAAELARDGQSYAGAGSTMLRLASQEARIESARGDAQRVAAALGRATTAMAATTDDDPGGVFRFPTGKAAYYASEARLAIGGASNIAHATTAAATALDLFAEAPPIDRPPEYIAAAQLDLISAHLAAGELDGADEMLQSVLAVPASSRTTPVLERIKSVPQRLPATVGYRGAELREQLMSYILSAKARDTAPPKELD